MPRMPFNGVRNSWLTVAGLSGGGEQAAGGGRSRAGGGGSGGVRRAASRENAIGLARRPRPCTRASSSARSDTNAVRDFTAHAQAPRTRRPARRRVVSVQAIQRTPPPSVSIASSTNRTPSARNVDRAGLDDLGPSPSRAFKRAAGNVEQTCVSGIGEGDAPPRIMPRPSCPRCAFDKTAGAFLRLGQPSRSHRGLFSQRRPKARSEPRRAPPHAVSAAGHPML